MAFLRGTPRAPELFPTGYEVINCYEERRNESPVCPSESGIEETVPEMHNQVLRLRKRRDRLPEVPGRDRSGGGDAGAEGGAGAETRRESRRDRGRAGDRRRRGGERGRV